MERPWPLQDLLVAARCTQSTLAEIVKVDPSTITRHLDSGLTLDEADRWCFALGMHPAEVWTAWSEVPNEQADLFEFL